MAKKDIVLKELLSDSVRFADLFNGALFEGEKVLNPARLSSLPNESAMIVDDKTGNQLAIQRYRDLIKGATYEKEFVVFACDNQTAVHYAMPVRLMLYDALTYTEQVKEIERTHKLNNDLKDSDEFLSGFKRSDSVVPVVSLLVYYGKDDWDGSIDLFGMMNISDKSQILEKYMSNYKLNIFNVCKVNNLELFNSDLKELFGMLKYSSNKKQMKEYVTNNKERYSNIDKVLYNAISIFLDDKNYLKRNIDKIKTENGGFNMCIAFDQMVEEGIDIGMEQGISIGIGQGIDIGIEQGIDIGIGQGIDIGIGQGINIGIEKGVDQTLTAMSMLQENKDINEIQVKTGLTPEKIKNLQTFLN